MSTSVFVLDLETDEKRGSARLRLSDAQGHHLAAHDVLLERRPPSAWAGIFDTGDHVRRYEANLLLEDGRTATAEDLMGRIGLFLGRDLLGPEIMEAIGRGFAHRTLLVRIPALDGGPLAAAFARAPWETARSAPGEEPLISRNVVSRLVLVGAGPSGREIVPDLAPDEPLRVLLVFAEAPGSRPLAMRQEREEILDLFSRSILPDLGVEVRVLCHGVGRRDLQESIRAAGGYHVVHWSGHGLHDRLELAADSGGRDVLTGAQLLNLFKDAGGFIPQVVFLSACHSASVVEIRDRETLEARLQERPAPPREGGEPDLPTALRRHGYTGTALELLRAGVPQVVAMRFEVGDAYARRLALGFYRHLLAEPANHPADTALAFARKDLLEAGDADACHAVDHATAVILGSDRVRLRPRRGRSPQLDGWRPRPQPILAGGRHDLDRPKAFVGRGAALSRLRTSWLSPKGPAAALVQGLAGLGKTSLAAEVIHLWHGRFDWVMAFQFRPEAMGSEEFYRRMDERLSLESPAYREGVRRRPAARIHLPPAPDPTGSGRYERLRENLVEALQNERILLVLDNFETNLLSEAGGGAYRSADPEWDRILETLASRLPETDSRLLVTSRHRLAALAPEGRASWIPLGPLPPGEAVLYLQACEPLARLIHSGQEGRDLALRVLEVSRGHPLILARLGDLAPDRAALESALRRVQAGGYGALPDVFAGAGSDAEREAERRYLEDVAVRSYDFLLERASPEARTLLWVVTLASEPVSEEMIQGVWSGETPEREMLRRAKEMVEGYDALPPELREKLPPPPPELLERIRKDGKGLPEIQPVGPILDALQGAGLLTKGDDGTYSFHEVVRERAGAWMCKHPEERRGRTPEGIWGAYGARYAAAFVALGNSARREEAAEAGRRAVSYLVRAQDFDAVANLASDLVTGTFDPSLLGQMITLLEATVDRLPNDRTRWMLRQALAEALDNAGRSDEALPLYERAVTEAEEAGDLGDVAVTLHNMAGALRRVGQLDRARDAFLRAAAAHREAGAPPAHFVGSELEALRIDVEQGRASEVLPEIERRLEAVRGWWRRHGKGRGGPRGAGRGIPREAYGRCAGRCGGGQPGARALGDLPRPLHGDRAGRASPRRSGAGPGTDEAQPLRPAHPDWKAG